MFTGIVRHVGSVQSVRPAAGGKRLGIDIGPLVDGLGHGDSVAVSGGCLTAAALAGTVAEFDVMAQTLETTTLGALRPGAKVNLEPALTLNGRLDGHLVQGHVDGAADVADIRRGDRWDISFRGADILGGLIAKGSVAVDGVSLTVADLTADGFRVSLIPTTLAETTLADLAVSARVNIETDLIGKYVQRFLQRLADGEGLTLAKLREAGFC